MFRITALFPETKLYLKKARESAVETAQEIVGMLKMGRSKTEIAEFFKNKFYHGYIKVIYPIDAMELNTGITIDLLARDFNV